MQRLAYLLSLVSVSTPLLAATMPQSDNQIMVGLAGYVAQVEGDVGSDGRFSFDGNEQQKGLDRQLSFSARAQMGEWAAVVEQFQSQFDENDQEYRQLSWEAALTYGRRSSRWLVEGLAGARYLKLDFRQGSERCCSGDWQPLIGLNLAYQPTQELTLSVHSDYALRSDDYSSRQQLAAAWDVTAHWQLELAYQWLLFERKRGPLPLDGTESGALLGINYRWY